MKSFRFAAIRVSARGARSTHAIEFESGFAWLLVFSVLLAAPTLRAQPDRLFGPIQETERVALPGSLHPLAKPEFDLGAAGPNLRLDSMMVGLRKTDAQQVDLDQFLKDVQDPKSPQYHHWLTPEQYAARFGASQNDINRIAAWLVASGFQVLSTSRGRNSIPFSGTAAQVEQVLHAPIHFYRVNGETHFANAAAVEIPKELGDLVAGIHGLTDFKLQPPLRTMHKIGPVSALGSGARAQMVTDSQGNTYMVPDDLATIYDLGPAYQAGVTGTGQAIAIVGESDIDLRDIETFRSLFNLPANDPVRLLVPGMQNPGQNGGMDEADLDLEWAGAFAPLATIYYVFAPDVFQAISYSIDNAVAPVLSSSFGLCEWRVLNSDLSLLRTYSQQAAAEGITWASASGDSGAAACENQNGPYLVAVSPMSVSVPASLPEVTGVGGTEFNEGNGSYFAKPDPNGGTAISYIPEVAWNDEALILNAYYGHTVEDYGGFSASGGGASVVWPKPSWQAGPGVPNDGARDVPDISLTASSFHDPYFTISGGNLVSGGGTSASTPSFAGILALLNEYLVRTGVLRQPGLGNLNPLLYYLGQNYSSVYHDITAGTNQVPCMGGSSGNCPLAGANSDGVNMYGYSAGPGYDQVTGWGSLDASKFIATCTTVIKSQQD